MPTLTPPASDWHALREWLIKARSDAQWLAEENRKLAVSRGTHNDTKAHTLSRVLDFMDELERGRVTEAAAEWVFGVPYKGRHRVPLYGAVD